MNRLKVMVSGANGRMGREVVKMLKKDDDLLYVGGIDPIVSSQQETDDNPIYQRLEEALIAEKPDVIVDFTNPHVVKDNVRTAIELGVSPVVGTTGLTLEDILILDKLAKEHEIGGVIAPNFAIGAVLMMKFAQTAAKYMPNVEIIEYHHDQKLDAPSGTALKTAELIQQVRKELKQGHPNEKETLIGARGGAFSGFRIHSVRLPGLVAHQEVILGDLGQTLTIRHDSIDRESFMPGVNLAIKKVKSLRGIIYGLEHLLN
ncbi:dihydrodipicolinate reductase [Tepidibacillus fermentans]|uniref:4-hydroxy-tetrahydrodipicolinate reductase n=2 Tax=Tepidibacillus fermentans TaxID=1281767 RepID=A0A4R3KKJ2_9BACI|nr:dihydrodipicolinate reductase [Tepidibacillus fermentans]